MPLRIQTALAGLMLSLIWLGTGCRDQTPGKSTSTDSGGPIDDTDEPGSEDLRSTLECLEGTGPFGELEREDTLVAMVPRIHWTASEELEVRTYTDVGYEEPLVGSVHDAATEGELLVLGIPALTEATVVLTAESDEGLLCSEPLEIAAANLNATLPQLTLSSFDEEKAQGGYLSTVVITEVGRFLVILNEYGEYIWVLNLERDSVAGVDFTNDGSGLLFMRWAAHADKSLDPPAKATPGAVVWLGFDGEVLDTVEVDELHTAFIELPNGNVASLVATHRELENSSGELQSVTGDGLVEVSRDGEVTQVWDVFDEFTPTLDGAMDGDKSFSHANSVSYFADTNDYLVGLANQELIIRFDRETGEHVWELGDEDGDFQSDVGEDMVMSPHSAELLDDGTLLLFNRNYDDSGETPITDMCSEAITLELDIEAGQAQQVHSYSAEGCVLVVFFGEAMHMENGNTRVIFSSSGQISEGTPDGETVWQVNADLGGAFGFGDWSATLP